MIPIKQSTASQIIELGPFLDSTDGDTEETGLTIANTDILLHKYGATATVAKNSGGATHMSNGRYYTTLDATDSNTLGPMRVGCHVSGALYVWEDCMVMTAAAYDIATGTTALGSASDLATAVKDEVLTEPTNLADKTLGGVLYHLRSRFFNLVTQTSTQQLVYKDDGSTVLGTMPVSDNGTTQTKGEASET